MIKHYGKLIFPSIQLNDEKFARITKGIIKKKDIIIVFNVVMMIVVICQSTILPFWTKKLFTVGDVFN